MCVNSTGNSISDRDAHVRQLTEELVANLNRQGLARGQLMVTVHEVASRRYVVLREGEDITSVYRVTEGGTLSRVVRWPRELGGDCHG